MKEKQRNYKKTKIELTVWIFIPVVGSFIAILSALNEHVMPNVSRQYTNDQRTIVGAPYQPFYVEDPEIPSYEWNGEGLITIWFDDAWVSQYTEAFPIMEKYGYKAALAVPTDHMAYDDYMSWEQIRFLQKNGWEISSHSVDHDCNF